MDSLLIVNVGACVFDGDRGFQSTEKPCRIERWDEPIVPGIPAATTLF
jgi:hypothetical protein